MRELTWQYIAGFFDGEGCVRVYSRTSMAKGKETRVAGLDPKITIVQTKDSGRRLLEEIQAFIETFGIKSRIQVMPKYSEKHSQCYALRIARRVDFIQFIDLILPHLRLKQVEAMDAKRYLMMFPAAPKGSKLRSMLSAEASARKAEPCHS